MNCPKCLTGRLECKSTRSEKPGRALRYRRCDACGAAFPTIETVLQIRAIPATPPPAHQKS